MLSRFLLPFLNLHAQIGKNFHFIIGIFFFLQLEFYPFSNWNIFLFVIGNDFLYPFFSFSYLIFFSNLKYFSFSCWNIFLFSNWNIFLSLIGIFSFFLLEYFPFSNWKIVLYPFFLFLLRFFFLIGISSSYSIYTFHSSLSLFLYLFYLIGTYYFFMRNQKICYSLAVMEWVLFLFIQLLAREEILEIFFCCCCWGHQNVLLKLTDL